VTVAPSAVREWARWATDSPLYQKLCEVIADEAELMRVLNRVENRPALNMLLGAVQYLMARSEEGELSGYYPNFAPEPEPFDSIGPIFKSFVLANEDAIVEIGSSRYTQTNECRRCVALLPMIWLTGLTRFHLVDIGTSAGLNLALDRYRYRWGDIDWGPQSPVELKAVPRRPLPETRELEILSRTGLDLNPIDPGSADDRLWLESLVWPEHHERRERLKRALDVATRTPIEFVSGDILDVLPGVLEGIPTDAAVVVMNSFVLNQFSPEQKEELDLLLATAGEHREVHRVSMEIVPGRIEAVLTIGDRSGWREVGAGHHHGEWVDFNSHT
jgi:hypothetical protein